MQLFVAFYKERQSSTKCVSLLTLIFIISTKFKKINRCTYFKFIYKVYLVLYSCVLIISGKLFTLQLKPYILLVNSSSNHSLQECIL